ncbi:hypothetical protein GGR56DRAFT_130914 [Xylariaceae sp. FL0804]|nr:hypothetical protein GGR56DRAFT_130914 [Xylariaceae sp. FL0804]
MPEIQEPRHHTVREIRPPRVAAGQVLMPRIGPLLEERSFPGAPRVRIQRAAGSYTILATAACSQRVKSFAGSQHPQRAVGPSGSHSCQAPQWTVVTFSLCCRVLYDTRQQSIPTLRAVVVRKGQKLLPRREIRHGMHTLVQDTDRYLGAKHARQNAQKRASTGAYEPCSTCICWYTWLFYCSSKGVRLCIVRGGHWRNQGPHTHAHAHADTRMAKPTSTTSRHADGLQADMALQEAG